MSGPGEMRLEMSSDPRYLCAVRQMVVQLARAAGFPEGPAGKVALAVDEALTNVMKHGYDCRPDGPIWITFTPVQDSAGRAGLRVEVRDEARQVDPSDIKGRDLANIRPGGLGVHIIREVMDEVTYQRGTPKGMRLVMTKWNTGKAATGCCDPEGGAPHG